MKSILILFLALGFTTNTFANEFPSWIEKSSKIQTFEQLLEWMKIDKFYKMTLVESKEVKNNLGQIHQETKIFFDDTSGCKNRKIVSTCIPFGLDTDEPVLFCQFLMTDCDGRNLFEMKSIK